MQNTSTLQEVDDKGLQIKGRNRSTKIQVGDRAELQVRDIKRNTVKEVGETALDQIEKILKRRAQEVVSISREGENWNVQLEVLERRAIPDTQDILGIYKLKLDSNLDVMEYKRVGMRHRGDMIVQEED